MDTSSSTPSSSRSSSPPRPRRASRPAWSPSPAWPTSTARASTLRTSTGTRGSATPWRATATPSSPTCTTCMASASDSRSAASTGRSPSRACSRGSPAAGSTGTSTSSPEPLSRSLWPRTPRTSPSMRCAPRPTRASSRVPTPIPSGPSSGDPLCWRSPPTWPRTSSGATGCGRSPRRRWGKSSSRTEHPHATRETTARY
mmetsp:Transcript_26388/g.67091  ORF Transcript_26388/g.67091 Transcript_26388/m.67091 type:complete len:200 (-) Transcript_26388:136-735(-)